MPFGRSSRYQQYEGLPPDQIQSLERFADTVEALLIRMQEMDKNVLSILSKETVPKALINSYDGFKHEYNRCLRKLQLDKMLLSRARDQEARLRPLPADQQVVYWRGPRVEEIQRHIAAYQEAVLRAATDLQETAEMIHAYHKHVKVYATPFIHGEEADDATLHPQQGLKQLTQRMTDLFQRRGGSKPVAQAEAYMPGGRLDLETPAPEG